MTLSPALLCVIVRLAFQATDVKSKTPVFPTRARTVARVTREMRSHSLVIAHKISREETVPTL